ncbi:TetR family transcriptional regulator [Bifidobacterium sp. ESL0800]|uniref:TetR/AcrR family transcriptional regulator n=1 Tax=Bifidobacterium sp. ESL0800 TaxID=2983236 RepID=UPI0023F71067|nr:TetR family transcriptional regulator [Bifidobacterium sp. ESL0800]WEV75028.1 TetR family transcriptional regulator [Bifidobacterium sp. ESL0800]
MTSKAEAGKSSASKGRATLNRETLLKNALAIVDEDGLDGLSLRALGKRIGVSYTALYRHLPDKNALLNGIAEQIWRETLSGVNKDADSIARIGGDWHEYIRYYALHLHTTLLRHPNAAVLVATHPIDTLEQYQLLAEAIKPFIPILADENQPTDLLGLIQGATILTTGYVLAEAVAPFGDSERSTTDPSDATREEAMRQSPELAMLLAPLSDTSTPWSMQAEYRKALDALIDGWNGAATQRR